MHPLHLWGNAHLQFIQSWRIFRIPAQTGPVWTCCLIQSSESYLGVTALSAPASGGWTACRYTRLYTTPAASWSTAKLQLTGELLSWIKALVHGIHLGLRGSYQAPNSGVSTSSVFERLMWRTQRKVNGEGQSRYDQVGSPSQGKGLGWGHFCEIKALLFVMVINSSI